MESEELGWESGPWVFGVQMLACAGMLGYRSLVVPKSLAIDKAVIVRFSGSFVTFQRTFLAVFILASVADALQVVYTEALYESYGFKRKEIAILLAVGYGSSLSLGTIIAASADYIGRKRACMLFGFFQALGCFAKQYPEFRILCFAHVSLGIATSLLYSSFESWMVVEHEKMGFRQEWLNETFWLMVFSNGVVATGCGALANVVANWRGFIGSAPLISAIVTALLSILAVKRTFTENVGTSPSLWRSIGHAVQCLSDRKVLLLGWTQACFDFSVVVFWYLWTPTLVADGREVHSAVIFTRLIASMVLGSIITACLLQGPYFFRPESFLPIVLFVGGISLFFPAYNHQEVKVLLWCFCVFHTCVGIALPSLARLRSLYIPNDRRAAVMSIFRIPVYFAVLVVLIQGGLHEKLDNSTIFGTAIAGLLSGAGCIHYIERTRGLPQELPLSERP
ncbi:uncharacterized protein [Physcomitrium patens]|uniref:Major facilitator superfamily (MFS) profile domain-containing protein n=2 Tax=Physcomitrium patens TaxID=3218 RepID=A0A2K1KNX4_PHYPA|nr:molybdate-anion transporter-like [Physcomitrium patens]PNR55467.1 hypothetical protein PHYPA_006364 [Physcomitrium patens]|eukprot:XP_024372470.1 molybdate-anion transporter-like [Physcomitrella patens]